MRRRDVMPVLTGASVAWPCLVIGESADRLRRIGVVYPFAKNDPGMLTADAAFRAELARLGWKEDDNLRIEERWEIADSARLRLLATELVALAPDAIFAVGYLGASMLHDATTSIPVVFINATDPVGQGLVGSLSRPGGNLTGFTNQDFSIVGKWIGMIKESAPHVTRVVFIYNADTAGAYINLYSSPLTAAADALMVEFVLEPVRDEAAIERVIDNLGNQPGSSLIVAADVYTYSHRERIATLATKRLVPSVFQWREGALAGGLMSYGSDNVDNARRAASYVDRILRGASPSELPVQQPTKFELVINLKTAKALGLTIPPSLLARADEVIE